MSFPYSLAIGPSSGSTPTQVLTFFDSWTLNRNLDDGCSLSFSLPGNSVPGNLIAELETDVWVYYNSGLEDRFRVTEVVQSWGPDGQDSISVSCVCYRRLLAARHVISAQTYTGVSQGTIVWNLIQHTQAQTNGNLGITLGSSGPAVLRSRSYPVGTKIFDAITDLTRVENGLTWDIDANLQLQVSQAGLYPIVANPVDLGGNALSLKRPSGAAKFGNVAVVAGDSQTTSVQIASSPTLAIDPRGRWERFAGFPSEKVQSNLLQAADGLLEEIISPAIVWEFVLQPDRFFSDSHYAIGDRVIVVHPDKTIPSSSNPGEPVVITPGYRISAQIITQSLSVGNSGEVSISMTAIQTPQTWDDVPASIAWDDVDISISWDDLATTLLL